MIEHRVSAARTLRTGVDAIERRLRKHFFGTRVHRWKITGWVHRHAVRFSQEAAAGQDLHVDFRGAHFVASSSDAGSAPMLRDGSFEKAELDVWLDLLRPGWTVVDVGANIGVYAVLSSQVVGRDGRVIAFEPEPANHGRLVKNLRLNDVENVEVIQACAGDEIGTATLFLAGGNTGAHSIVRRSSEVAVTCPVVTLDTAIGPTAHIDAIKVDVEGFEVQVLRGARALIERCHPVILVELNAETDILQEIYSLMDSGYRSCRFIHHGKVRRVGVADLRRLPSERFLGNLVLTAD